MNDDLNREEILKNAPLLAKWLNLLFLLILPAILAQLLNNRFTMVHMTFFYALGQVLNFACFFAYGYILLKLSDVETSYHTAGVCNIITASLNVVIYLIEKNSTSIFCLVLTIPVVIFSVIAINKEYHAHSAVLSGVDDALSLNWLKLWKWYLIFLICMVASNFVIIIVPILGLLTTIFAMCGTVMVNIFQLFFLYRTAKTFKNISTHTL